MLRQAAGPGPARHAIVALMGVLSAAAGMDARAAEVHYRDTQILRVDDQHVGVRASFEIRNGPQKWFRVYFQVLRDEKTPLSQPDGKALLAQWADLFPPAEPANALYTDIRMPLPLKAIRSAAGGLPRGKQTVLWVVCAVWDAAERKFLGSGWPARAALLVTTDEAGKIVAMSDFNVDSARPRPHDPEAKIKARTCKLDTRHLSLHPGVALYKAAYADASKPAGGQHFLIGADSQADLYSAHRGRFFGRIDTPKKALEFALLDWPGGILIKTAEQYREIAKALKSRGWPGPFLNEKPAFVGIDVTELSGLGYRVRATLIAQDPARTLLRGVVLLECNVSHDGRFRHKVTELIRPPDLGPRTTPATPGEPAIAIEAKPYDELVRGLLTEIGSQRLPDYVVVTGDVATIPVYKGCDTTQYKAPG